MRARKLAFMGSGLIAAAILVQLAIPPPKAPATDPKRSFEGDATVPPPVKAIVARACYDCHSNETRWPWYARVRPGAWFVRRDVEQGRARLNLSTWIRQRDENGKPRHSANRMNEICDVVAAGAMPPKNYIWLHSDAKLTKADVDTICNWAQRRDPAAK